jgi:hypothetical protein
MPAKNIEMGVPVTAAVLVLVAVVKEVENAGELVEFGGFVWAEGYWFILLVALFLASEFD